MAGFKDVVRHQLQSGSRIIDKFTSGLTDDEYFVPAIRGGGHTAWLLGHVACSEDWAASLALNGTRRIPQTVIDLFKGSAPCSPDREKFPNRRAIDDLFKQTRQATLAALEAFDERKILDPSPDAAPKDYFPTMGSIWALIGTHQFWHIGQIADCRRAMNKGSALGM
ncbi:MAG: DinB family protein [Planctomycetota bacterium]